jgi:conjugal transfer pilus assembly protein TraF
MLPAAVKSRLHPLPVVLDAMFKPHKIALIAAFLMIHTPGISAFESNSDSRFYDRKAEGWFWYNEEIPEPEPELEELPEPIASVIAEPPTETAPPQPSGPSIFSAAWFRENLPKYQDAAWDNPTVENVRTYMYLQRYAMDRSEQFADTTELAVIGDPFLDEESRRPSAVFASQKVDLWAGREATNLSQKIGQRAGIFFFFDSKSDTSIIQAPILQKLADEDGYNILPISIDGQPLPGNMFPDYRVDEGQAENLGVEVLPALFLVTENREIEPIAQGVLALNDLKRRIILVSKRRGIITDEEFNKTRPFEDGTNIAAILDSKSVQLADIASKSEEFDENFIPPDQLGAFIRNQLTKDR